MEEEKLKNDLLRAFNAGTIKLYKWKNNPEYMNDYMKKYNIDNFYYCKCCEGKVIFSYLDKHKVTKKHIVNQKKFLKKKKNQNVEMIVKVKNDKVAN
jgi:hypothetical protein